MIILRVLARRLRVTAWLGLLLLVLSGAAAAQPTQPILFLLDRFSAAYGLSLEQGWVALLDSRLQNEDRPYHTVNASISGDTSAGGLRRLPGLLETHEPRIVIVELGGNDGLRGYPVGQLRNNLISMIELIETADATALILPMEIPPNLGKFYTDAFRATFTEAAEQTGAALADFPLVSVALEPELMQSDGIHPTAAAQPLILDTVWSSLEELL